MFHMKNIGFKISELRKKNNMTQMELADKMNISFQAVSNWERGNSMPDISKLPELAKIFGVSVDEIIGTKSPLLDSIVNGRMEKYIADNGLTKDEIKEIAPIIKPSQAKHIFENIKDAADIKGIEDLLPFLKLAEMFGDSVDESIGKSSSVPDGTENGRRKEDSENAKDAANIRELEDLLPFLDQETIDDIARKFIAEGKSIDDIAMFVSRDIVNELAIAAYETKGMDAIEDIAPFVSRDVLKQIAEKEYAKNGLRNFEAVAPFLDGGYLSQLAKQAVEKDGIKAISPIAPFLDRQMLTEFVKEKFL